MHVSLERMLRENEDMIASTRSRLSEKLGFPISNFLMKGTETVIKHGRTGIRLITAKFSADGHKVD